MPRLPAQIHLDPEERATLRTWQSSATERRLAERAEIVLRAADGHATGAIAAAMGTRPARVSKWRTRFARQRLRGLADAPRVGAPRRYDSTAEHRLLDHLGQPPLAGYRTWTGPLLAGALGDLSVYQVWRILRRHGISLRRRRS